MRVNNFLEVLSRRIVKSAWGVACLLVFTLLAAGALTSAIAAVPAPARPTASAQNATSEQLQTLARSMTFDWAKAHPINATFLGLSDEDGLLDTPSLAANARDLAAIREWQKQLAAISLDGAALKDVDDAKLLGAQLTSMERQYTVYKTFEKDPSGPSVAILSAIYTQFLHLPVAGTSGATAGDVTAAWEKIIARLAGAPAYIAAGNALVTRPGHLYGVTGAEQLDGAPSLLSGPLTDAAKAQLSAERFAAFEKARDATLAAMAQTKKFIDEHAAAWPENYAMGRDAYNAMLRDEELLPFDSSEIECMGATSWRTAGPCKSGCNNWRRSAVRRSVRRAAAGSRPAARR